MNQEKFPPAKNKRGLGYDDPIQTALINAVELGIIALRYENYYLDWFLNHPKDGLPSESLYELSKIYPSLYHIPTRVLAEFYYNVRLEQDKSLKPIIGLGQKWLKKIIT